MLSLNTLISPRWPLSHTQTTHTLTQHTRIPIHTAMFPACPCDVHDTVVHARCAALDLVSPLQCFAAESLATPTIRVRAARASPSSTSVRRRPARASPLLHQQMASADGEAGCADLRVELTEHLPRVELRVVALHTREPHAVGEAAHRVELALRSGGRKVRAGER